MHKRFFLMWLLGNVGINTTAQHQRLCVGGSCTLMSGGSYQIANTSVLSSTTLGSEVINSSLTQVGTLRNLTTNGNVRCGGGYTIVGDHDCQGQYPISTGNGVFVASNFSNSLRECTFMNNDTTGNGFTFYQRTGTGTSLSLLRLERGTDTMQPVVIKQWSGNSAIIASSQGSLRLEAGGSPSYTIYSASIYNSTTAAGASVSITGTNGHLQRSTSSARYKTDIEDVSDAFTEKIWQLRPVWYRSLCPLDRRDWSYYGLIAEEVATVDPRLCFWGPNEETGELQPEGVMYDRIVPLLLKECAKLRDRVSALEAHLAQASSSSSNS